MTSQAGKDTIMTSDTLDDAATGRITQFALGEGGATTVDWTVLAGGVVGLGIATMAVVSRGTEDLSNDIGLTLSGIASAGGQLLASLDFDDGMGPFVGGNVRDVPGFGPMLLLDGTDNRGGIGTSATFDLDPDAPYTQIAFDMAFIDSWDGETAYVYLNGEPVALGTFTHIDHPYLNTGDLPPQMEELGVVSVDFGEATASQGGYFNASHASHYIDYTQPVQITMATNGASTLDIGFGTDLNSSYQDESLGIDALTVASADSP
ncbi:hypothetical protein [Rhodobacteraceae bacterium W635]|uniref:hypothetical protein n=1 Tax=Nioella halotolerans TaxID=2303578 RepID=UPI000E3E91BA